jgi:hypothetical protein
MAMLIVVLSVLIVQVCSKAVIVDTTSGQLLGTQTDGGSANALQRVVVGRHATNDVNTSS